MSELRGDEDPQESKCKTQIFLISLDMVGLINPSDCRIVLKCARQRLLLQRGQGPLTALIGHRLVAKKCNPCATRLDFTDFCSCQLPYAMATSKLAFGAERNDLRRDPRVFVGDVAS